MLRIMKERRSGPRPDFTDMDLFWTLCVIRINERIGRELVSDITGIRTGSTRTMIGILKNMGFVEVTQRGCAVTQKGISFLEGTGIIPVDIGESEVAFGKFKQSVLIRNASCKITNGVEQYNDGIRAGGNGCTSIVICNGTPTFLPDINFLNIPSLPSSVLQNDVGMTDNDILMTGSGDDPRSATVSVLYAAFKLV
jgi:hypothetical protein